MVLGCRITCMCVKNKVFRSGGGNGIEKTRRKWTSQGIYC